MTTQAAQTGPTAGKGGNPQYANTWQGGLIYALGGTPTATNVEALTLWAQSEGTTWANNPLAVSGIHPGATTCIAQCTGGSPVMAYATMEQGVAANANFLLGDGSTQQQQAYSAIVSNLTNGSDLVEIWGAINATSWCKGCQGGLYPSALYHVALKGGTSVPLVTPNTLGAATPGANIPNPLKALQTLEATLTSAAFWERILIFAGGLGLIGVGLVLLLSSSKTVRTTATEATMAAAV